jgi:hypothetical protein
VLTHASPAVADSLEGALLDPIRRLAILGSVVFIVGQILFVWLAAKFMRLAGSLATAFLTVILGFVISVVLAIGLVLIAPVLPRDAVMVSLLTVNAAAGALAVKMLYRTDALRALFTYLSAEVLAVATFALGVLMSV